MAFEVRPRRQRSARPLSAAVFKLLFVILAVSLGCSDPTQPPAPAILGELPPSRPSVMVDYPEYVCWSRFPVGTRVVRRREHHNELGYLYETTELELVKKTPESITITQRIRVERPEGVEENEPLELVYPAKVRSIAAAQDSSSASDDDFLAKPSPTARMVGRETVDVLGQKVEATVFEWTEALENGAMQVRLWQSDAVPGRIVRKETSLEAPGNDAVEVIVELDIPGVSNSTAAEGATD
ncbi:MAG: hypothetical protein KatS3mg111_0256 [Pirellulaceae bacterium]|nr:MAG: hypothetical protein KatS3mg111_0256 [Pirellulaceae bacterium]